MNIKLRKVNPADCDALLYWRNDALSRANSKNMDIIEKSAHDAWFAEALRDAEKKILIAEISGIPAGMIRLDERDLQNGFNLSWMVAPEYRGRGVASFMLRSVCQMMEKSELFAEIKVHNAPSQRIAQKLGFSCIEGDGGINLWHRPAAKV